MELLFAGFWLGLGVDSVECCLDIKNRILSFKCTFLVKRYVSSDEYQIALIQIIIDREAREIIRLVASIRPSVRLFVYGDEITPSVDSLPPTYLDHMQSDEYTRLLRSITLLYPLKVLSHHRFSTLNNIVK